MKAWSCEHCNAETKQDDLPEFCPICGKRGKFTGIELPEPSEEDKEITKKYDEVVKTIEKYEEGTPPRSIKDAAGCCGGGHNDEEGHKNHS